MENLITKTTGLALYLIRPYIAKALAGDSAGAVDKQMAALANESHAAVGPLVIDATCGNGHDTLALAEMMFVERKLKEFAEALPGIKEQNREIDVLSPVQTQEGFQLGLHFKDGSTSLLQDLPAGYRRLYSIVFDMAYRAYILNGDAEPEGLAIIDEIDLHLHPELEKEVLNVFHKTFRKVQFIVSTHSPMVLTNLQPDDSKIMRMDIGRGEPATVEDIYGLDYNTGVEDVMGVDAKNVEIDNLVSTLAFLEGNAMERQAENVKALLLEKLKGDREHLEKLLDRRRKEMGDEIHR